MNLGSLRTAILEQVEADAARRRAEIEAGREQRLASARAEATSLVEQGKLEGRAAGTHEAARRRRRAQRLAREAQLSARGALYGELRRQARAQVLELRSEPAYGALLDRLVKAAQAQLGAGAELEIDPPGIGGVIARSGSRSVDYTLPSLADRALAELGDGVEKLWR